MTAADPWDKIRDLINEAIRLADKPPPRPVVTLLCYASNRADRQDRDGTERRLADALREATACTAPPAVTAAIEAALAAVRALPGLRDRLVAKLHEYGHRLPSAEIDEILHLVEDHIAARDFRSALQTLRDVTTQRDAAEERVRILAGQVERAGLCAREWTHMTVEDAPTPTHAETLRWCDKALETALATTEEQTAASEGAP